MNYRFRWDDRLHRRQDFKQTIRNGRRLTNSGLTMWIHRTSDVAHPRMGLAIPRTYGNAVQRNRLKRLLREVFRLRKGELVPDVDMVFSAKPLSTEPRYATIEPLVLELWKRAHVLRPS
jgi:ribonuclease P protein component